MSARRLSLSQLFRVAESGGGDGGPRLGPNSPKPNPSQTKKNQGNGLGFSLDFFVRIRGFSMGYEQSKEKNFQRERTGRLGGVGEGERRRRRSMRFPRRASGPPSPRRASYGIHTSQVARDTFPTPRAWTRGWRGAPDGVWPAASTQVGLHEHHRELTSEQTCFPHPIRPSATFPASRRRGNPRPPATS